MWKINETFDYALGRNGKGHISLNPNKDLTPFDLKPPVIWEGFINEHRISLTWNGGSFKELKSYEVGNIPLEISELIGLVIKKIDDYYKYLD